MSDTALRTHNPELGKSIIAGGITTNYHEAGDGPPVVMIHGSGAGVTGWANWRLNMPELSKTFRVIVPDLIGFGYSDCPPEGIRDKRIWVDHLVGLLDALRLEKASFVGNSFGGYMTLAMMIAHPERVERAVVMGGHGLEIPLTPNIDAGWAYTPSLENMRTVLKTLSRNPAAITEELVQSRYEASIRPGSCESYAATFNREDRLDVVKMISSTEEDLAEIQHELLILHGAEDATVPPEGSYKLAGLVKNSDMVLFADCGHWVQVDRLPSFNRIVAQFLANGLRS